MQIDIKRLTPDAVLPKKKYLTDAGADLYANMDTLVKAGCRTIVPLGFAVALLVGYEMQIRPRSGMSLKGMEGTKELPMLDTEGNLAVQTYRFDADVLFGTIDSGYRDEVNAIIVNHSSYNFFIPKGTRVAQCVIEKHEDYAWNEVEELNDEGNRGGGLGHSGTR